MPVGISRDQEVALSIHLSIWPVGGVALLAGALALAGVENAAADEIASDPAASQIEHDSAVLQPDPVYQDARYDFLGTTDAGTFFGSLIADALGLTGIEIAATEDIESDPAASQTEHDSEVFRPNPAYEDAGYDTEAQLEIYGGKSAYPTPRPLIEAGRELYTAGPFSEAGTFLGTLNPTYNQFYVYGDWRTAIAYNDNGAVEVGQVATRLNLDFDYRFTSTERIHWFIGPLNGQGEFTRCEFFGDDAPNNDPDRECDLQLDGNLDALFLKVTAARFIPA